MRADQMTSPIASWFAHVGGAGLKLPSGWFGRPHDNFLHLSWVSAAANRLMLVLDDQLVLVVAHPTTLLARNNSLQIGGYRHAVWDWDEYGNGRSHIDCFDDQGTIEFVPAWQKLEA
jgi:hypothetical protein